MKELIKLQLESVDEEKNIINRESFGKTIKDIRYAKTSLYYLNRVLTRTLDKLEKEEVKEEVKEKPKSITAKEWLKTYNSLGLLKTIKHIAKDQDNKVFGYSTKPEVCPIEWRELVDSHPIHINIPIDFGTDDWKETLTSLED